jgi:peptidoglycan/LPS O-acetylase OafA/YrhL
LKPYKLTASESLMLDLIRVGAAMFVAFGHLTQHYFSSGWRDLTTAAQFSVFVFFILSGFVIRYVTTRRANTFGHYMGDRFSRIYSVGLPALVFTCISDPLAHHINPAYYAQWIATWKHPVHDILLNLIFCGQNWTWRLSPLSNSPYWSINCEVAYYIIYGLFFYLSGPRRWILATLACLFFGPKIVLAFSLWIAGALLYEAYRRWDAVAFQRVKHYCLWLLFPLLVISTAYFFPAVKQRMLHSPTVWRFSERQVLPLYLYPASVSWMAFLVVMLRWARRWGVDNRSRPVRLIRFFAEGTFPIYLFHFPMFVLIGAAIPYNHGSAVQKLAIFAAVIAICVGLGPLCNMLKIRLRSMFTPLAIHARRPTL